MPTFKSLSIELFQSWEDHSSISNEHFPNTNSKHLEIPRGRRGLFDARKNFEKNFFSSRHTGFDFTLIPAHLFYSFYFVQLVWESWFDGDKRWNGSLGRIRASQASDTEVNVTQGARLTFPYHRPVKKPDFHHLDSTLTSFQTFSPRKNYPSFNLRALTSLAWSHFPDSMLNFSVICESDGTGYSIFSSSIF